MTIHHTLQLGLDALGKQTGAQLTLDDRGWATLRFDATTDVTLGADAHLGQIFMLAPVCRLTDANRNRLMQEALEMSLLGVGTGGCLLGYDRTHDQLMLSVSFLGAEFDSTGFVNQFSRFLDVVTRLKGTFDQLLRSPNEQGSTPLISDHFSHFHHRA